MWTCSDGARLFQCVAPRCCTPKIVFHKNEMKPIIRPSGTICYSLLYFNSLRSHNRLKYLSPVIWEKMERLPGNTKNRLFTRSWTARVQFPHPWADNRRVSFWFVCNGRSTLRNYLERVPLFYWTNIGVSLRYRGRVHSSSGDLGWPDPHPPP